MVAAPCNKIYYKLAAWPFSKVRTRDKRLNGYFSFLASHSSARQPLAQRGGRVRADD